MYSDSQPNTAIVPTEYAAFRRIRWGAVFAGTLIALVTMAALNLLGVGIGFASINPTTEANPMAGLGVGTIIWYVLSSLIALFAGGFVAGKMSGFPKKSNAAMHGLLTWSLFTLVSLYLFTTAMGRVVSGVGSAISSVTSGVTNTVQSVVPNDLGQQISQQIRQSDVTISDVRREAFALLEDTDKAALDPDNVRQDARQVRNAAQRNADDVATSPYGAGQEVNDILDRIQRKGGNIVEAADKDALINVITDRTDMTEAEARKTVNGWSGRIENTAQEVQERFNNFTDRAADAAPEVAGNIADGLATAALLGFVGLMLGALAGYFGGATGRQTDLTLADGQSVSGVNVER